MEKPQNSMYDAQKPCKSTHICNVSSFMSASTTMILKDVLYEVRCLKSNEDMILALTGQFKQLSHEPEKFR